MFYVNYVSDTCWLVIFERGQFVVTVHESKTESEANEWCDAMKRLDGRITDFAAKVEASFRSWWKSLAMLGDAETEAFNNR